MTRRPPFSYCACRETDRNGTRGTALDEPLAIADLMSLCRQPGLWAVDPFLSWHFLPWVAAQKVPARGGRSVALIQITGVMLKSHRGQGTTSTMLARQEIMDAAADPDVSGIVLAIDSPGGTVSGTESLAAEVRAANRVKPVVAHVEDTGASAAYWVASQAGQVFASNSSSLVGSIGTYQVVYDESVAAERLGVRALVFATGSLKGMGTPGTQVTEEQSSHLQSLVNAVQTHFDAAVQKGRGLSNKELSAVKHGGVMTAHNALDARLIDGIRPLSKTIAEMSSATKAQPGRAAAAVLPMVSRQVLPTLRSLS